MPRVSVSLHSQRVKSGQAFKSWSNSQLWTKTGQSWSNKGGLSANIHLFGFPSKFGLQD